MNAIFHRHRANALAAAIALCIGAAHGTQTANAEALRPDDAVADTPVQTDTAPARYTILLREPALASYEGGVGRFAAPPRIADGRHAGRLDVHSTAATAWVAHLVEQQTAFLADMARQLGRSPTPVFTFQHALNGVVVELTPAEAAVIAQRADVLLVEREREYELLTDRGPAFIGADTIWDGTSTGGVQSQGEGVVAGVIDTGINWQSPSFAATGPIDAYEHVNPLGSGTYLGLCGPNPPNADLGRCNDKLIGMYNFASSSPTRSATDQNGHGSHTASTVTGNHRDAPFGGGTFRISGVAPHANVVAFLACPSSCPTSATAASVNQAVADGVVDVLNFSISGGTSPWADSTSLAFLGAHNAGIFVAASAGNDGPGPSTINHVEPWTTTVAASTHDRVLGFTFNLTAPSPLPPETQGIPMRPGALPIQTADLVDAPIIRSPDFDDGSNDGCSAYPAGTFERNGDGALAVLHLDGNASNCASGARRSAALAAGAVGVIFVDVVYLNLGAADTSWSILMSDWDAVYAQIEIDPDLATASALLPASSFPGVGDVIADFSSRGPNLGLGGQFLVKPEISAPGVDILAAYIGGPDSVALENGTSMAGPHIAGSAVLMRSLHADWTPMQIKSALMLNAKTDGLVNVDSTPGDPWDRGAGRVDLAAAARTGLIMDETGANFSAANPANGGTLATLNLPSVALGDCTAADCSFTRTLQSALATSAEWTLDVTGLPGASVTPASFTLAPGASQVVTIDIAPATLAGGWSFGSLHAVADSSEVSAAHLPIAVRRIAGGPLIQVSALSLAASVTAGDTATQDLVIGNAGSGTLTWSVDTASPGCAPPAWLGAAPPSGSLGAGASEDLTISIDTTGLGEGDYSAPVCVASNDSGVPLVEVVVNLAVEPADRIFDDGFDG